MRDFKIHCIALTKNEADVVGLCLREASRWADHIYVYDGASTDGTWEIVKQLESDCIIPWKQDGKVFREGLRAEVFEAFRRNSSPGDWWLQLNVDEFYPESPRTFFSSLASSYSFVWGINVEFVLTQGDIDVLDFSQPFEAIMPQLRHYYVTWSEPRAFRYRDALQWSLSAAWPIHAGLVAPQRIVFKHYPYRSPLQIQSRLDVRREARARGFEGWAHASQQSWKEKIVDASRCSVDDKSGRYEIDETKLPRHLEPALMRAAKRVLHGTGIWP
jgi:glycosyltransferase involved in cell wall biosynthesis